VIWGNLPTLTSLDSYSCRHIGMLDKVRTRHPITKITNRLEKAAHLLCTALQIERII